MKDAYKERVQSAIADSGLSYTDIARKMGGITPQAVRSWAAGLSIPSKEKVPALSRVVKKSEVWLLTGVGDTEDFVDDSILSIPVLDARASAGDGLMLFEDEQVLRRLDIDINWLRARCRFSHPDNLYTITASGDSMVPTIEDGDFLLVDSGVDTIRSDSIYIARVNDCIYVKRFQLTPRGTLLMLSDNTRYTFFLIGRANSRIF